MAAVAVETVALDPGARAGYRPGFGARAIGLADDLAVAHERFDRELPAVVVARHRVAVGPDVEDRDLARRIARHQVFAEVVAALADRADDTPGDRGRRVVAAQQG